MHENNLMKLILNMPLIYFEVDELPLDNFLNCEYLVCYEIDHEQSKSIEPNSDTFLKKLIFKGYKLDDIESENSFQSKTVSLPAGTYLFVQQRIQESLIQESLIQESLIQESLVCDNEIKIDEILNCCKWLDMAIEQQKDGLWERHKLGTTLYIRYLFEDGCQVIQLFRTLNF